MHNKGFCRFLATVEPPIVRHRSPKRKRGQLGSVVSFALRGNGRLMNEPGQLIAHHKAEAAGYEAENFRPITPATINNRQTTRAAVTGSPNRTMPRIAVPTAPMPVQTA